MTGEIVKGCGATGAAYLRGAEAAGVLDSILGTSLNQEQYVQEYIFLQG